LRTTEENCRYYLNLGFQKQCVKILFISIYELVTPQTYFPDTKCTLRVFIGVLEKLMAGLLN